MGKRRLVLIELIFGALLACLRIVIVFIEPILVSSILDNQVNLLGSLLRVDGI